MLIRNAWTAGMRVDLRAAGGRITEVRARTVGADVDSGAPLIPLPGEAVLEGGLVCPPLAEPHVHLDAALLGPRAPNVSGTLIEGIRNWAQLRDELDADDVVDRASRTLALYALHGCLRVRTHVDTGSRLAAEALLSLRESARAGLPGLRGVCPDSGRVQPVPVEVQVVAFPQEGIPRRPGQRAAWEDVVRLGCDAVGAIPHLERTAEEGWASLRLALDLALSVGAAVDVHCDETDDPGSRHLEVLCAAAIDRQMGARVVAGHCTSLHSQPNAYAQKVVALCAEAGLQIVTNPLDNIVLQGRYDGYPKVRGLTRVDAFWAAGVPVGIGHDSVMDPWYRLGTANLLDPAWMLVHAGHLFAEDELTRAFLTLSRENHRPFGGAPRLLPGEPANFCWFPADDPIEALRLRPRPRVFVGGCEVVAAP
jgi:cytosine deaminase